ncbi:MAG TPA: NAD(P)H-binding protein [Pseudolabrys sp.]|nr:NAD(P)H-binding protein [Pseudolabrys sp.]
MKIFLAGAGGAIGKRLTPLLCAIGHSVVGTTRSADKANAIAKLGAQPVVVDVFDAAALKAAVVMAAPDVVIHQLTDLAFAPGTPQYEEGLARNARIRIEGTANLVAAAKAAGVNRLIAQSVAWLYKPGPRPRVETDPLLPAEGAGAKTIEAVVSLEQAVLALPEGIVLRFGFFYGSGTWSPDKPSRLPSIHIDAAAQATALAIAKGKLGLYNVAEDDPSVSSEKARRELGFNVDFRIKP